MYGQNLVPFYIPTYNLSSKTKKKQQFFIIVQPFWLWRHVLVSSSIKNLVIEYHGWLVSMLIRYSLCASLSTYVHVLGYSFYWKVALVNNEYISGGEFFSILRIKICLEEENPQTQESRNLFSCDSQHHLDQISMG